VPLAEKSFGIILIDQTEPNSVVEPIHEKAMPVMQMTPDDVDQWLRGVSVADALEMQKPAPDDAIVIRPPEKKAA
jgi:putative SOS response-associated peptidase YedK